MTLSQRIQLEKIQCCLEAFSKCGTHIPARKSPWYNPRIWLQHPGCWQDLVCGIQLLRVELVPLEIIFFFFFFFFWNPFLSIQGNLTLCRTTLTNDRLGKGWFFYMMTVDIYPDLQWVGWREKWYVWGWGIAGRKVLTCWQCIQISLFIQWWVVSEKEGKGKWSAVDRVAFFRPLLQMIWGVWWGKIPIVILRLYHSQIGWMQWGLHYYRSLGIVVCFWGVISRWFVACLPALCCGG